jgi:hypothetical protein
MFKKIFVKIHSMLSRHSFLVKFGQVAQAIPQSAAGGLRKFVDCPTRP